MQKICFNIPIRHLPEEEEAKSDHPSNNKILEFIDDYFCWTPDYYRPAPSSDGLKKHRVVELSPKQYKQSAFRAFVKVATYLLVIVPIIIVFAKLIYRGTMQFRLNAPQNFPDGLRKKPLKTPPPSQLLKNDINIFKTYVNELPGCTERLIQNIDHLLKNANMSIGDIRKLLEDDEQIETETRRIWNNRQTIKLYLRGIIDLFENSNIGPDLKNDIVLNISRDCGSDSCDPGTITKLQKEFNRLYWAIKGNSGTNSTYNFVEQQVLSELKDLKIEILNNMAREARVGLMWEPHYVACAQVQLEDELGLDAEEGRQDEHHNSDTVTQHFNTKEKKRLIIECFKMLCTPELITETLIGKLNAAKDIYKTTLHLNTYIEFIKHELEKKGYNCPSSVEKLQKGPLASYLPQAMKNLKELAEIDPNIDQNDVKEIYSAAFECLLNDRFFVYDEDMCMQTELKPEGMKFILKATGILS